MPTSRLGLQSALVTNLGDDQNGKDCLDALRKENVGTDFISSQKNKLTNYHYVLWFEDDRTILVKHQPYEYKLPDIGQPKWIYLSSIGNNTEKYHAEVADYVIKNPEIKLAFQPGTFQIYLGTEKLEKIYQHTEIIAVNKKEAGQILKQKNSDIKELLFGLNKLGPKKILITDGPAGAYFYDAEKIIFMPPYPDPKPPYERTGAGDAYTSTFVSAMILGQSPEEALKWAGINSMSVVQQIGAQKGLLTQNEIKNYLEKAPEDYKAKNISL
jgi:sugar/nucleoside kinase (ribokinase family)